MAADCELDPMIRVCVCTLALGCPLSGSCAELGCMFYYRCTRNSRYSLILKNQLYL